MLLMGCIAHYSSDELNETYISGHAFLLYQGGPRNVKALL